MNTTGGQNHKNNNTKGKLVGEDARFHSVFADYEIRRIDSDKKIYCPKHMFSCNERTLKQKLGEDNISARKVMIPLADNEKGIFFWVLFNETENASYVHKTIIKRIKLELNKYTNASRYYIDGKRCHANTQEKYYRYLHDCSGALVLVKVRDFKTKKTSFFLIGDEDFTVDHKSHFYPYIEEEAREVLAGCSIYDRFGNFRVGKKRYEVVQMWYGNREARHKLESLLPDEVFLVSEDVYMNELEHLDECFVLLYSTFYEKYEYIEAKVGDFDDVWISQGIYDAFLKKQRKILAVANKIELSPDSDLEEFIKEKDLFSGLASESILKKQGYNVSRESGLSKEQRQKILADIVDQGLCTKRNTISRLEFYIKCHNSEKDADARKKWEEDICFIRQYKSRKEYS